MKGLEKFDLIKDLTNVFITISLLFSLSGRVLSGEEQTIFPTIKLSNLSRMCTKCKKGDGGKQENLDGNFGFTNLVYFR